MANPILQDIDAFEPHGGGYGVRFTCSSTASTPRGLPGSGGASDPNLKLRVRICVGWQANALVRIGQGDLADSNCMEMLAGTVEMFTVPYSPGGVTVSAIAIGGSTTISAVAGRGM